MDYWFLLIDIRLWFYNILGKSVRFWFYLGTWKDRLKKCQLSLPVQLWGDDYFLWVRGCHLMPHFVTGGGNQQRHCQVIPGPDGSGSERERLPSGMLGVWAIVPSGHLLEGDLADGKGLDKFLSTYCMYSVAATQVRKYIFWLWVVDVGINVCLCSKGGLGALSVFSNREVLSSGIILQNTCKFGPKISWFFFPLPLCSFCVGWQMLWSDYNLDTG